MHFNSVLECKVLGPIARERNWRVGIRVRPPHQVDPDDPLYSGPFGMDRSEALEAITFLREAGVEVHTVQFHLHSNVRDISAYIKSIDYAASVCDNSKLTLVAIDLGGGLPSPAERERSASSSDNFLGIVQLRGAIEHALSMFPSLSEVWLENGRYFLGSAGALVLSVVDVKSQSDARYVICDGGRVNHAFVSRRQRHEIGIIPGRQGKLVQTTISGPTCMAYDWLERNLLPEDIGVGDLLVWRGAGAYHIPWETRFSGGLAPVVWIDEDGTPRLARRREQFDHWWGQWE